MKNNTLRFFILMHLSFLVYCSYAVIGKLASGLDFLSLKFIAVYCAVFLILALYAVLWQQVLKHISLTTAIANKSVTIIWGLVAGFFLFNEVITVKKITGAVIILAGIILLSLEKTPEGETNND